MDSNAALHNAIMIEFGCSKVAISAFADWLQHRIAGLTEVAKNHHNWRHLEAIRWRCKRYRSTY